MPIKLNGSTSGDTTLQAAATAASNTITLPGSNGMLVAQSTTMAPTNGQIPIGNGTDYTAATITAGSNITVTNGSGTITIAATSSVNNLQLAKAWVNFDGTLTGTITPRANYNISSVTKNGTGDYTINFTSALTDANYAWAGGTPPNGLETAGGTVRGYSQATQLAASCRIVTRGSTTTAFDTPIVTFIAFGN